MTEVIVKSTAGGGGLPVGGLFPFMTIAGQPAPDMIEDDLGGTWLKTGKTIADDDMDYPDAISYPAIGGDYPDDLVLTRGGVATDTTEFFGTANGYVSYEHKDLSKGEVTFWFHNSNGEATGAPTVIDVVDTDISRPFYDPSNDSIWIGHAKDPHDDPTDSDKQQIFYPRFWDEYKNGFHTGRRIQRGKSIKYLTRNEAGSGKGQIWNDIEIVVGGENHDEFIVLEQYYHSWKYGHNGSTNIRRMTREMVEITNVQIHNGVGITGRFPSDGAMGAIGGKVLIHYFHGGNRTRMVLDDKLTILSTLPVVGEDITMDFINSCFIINRKFSDVVRTLGTSRSHTSSYSEPIYVKLK